MNEHSIPRYSCISTYPRHPETKASFKSLKLSMNQNMVVILCCRSNSHHMKTSTILSRIGISLCTRGKSTFRPRGRENNEWTLHSEYYAPEALSPNENNSVAMEQQIIPLPMFCQAKSMKTPGVHLKSQMFSPSYTERRMYQSLPNPYGWNKAEN